MLNKRKPLAVDTVFTLAMICVFAATSMLLVLFGARVYKNVVADMDNNFYTRTGLSYVTNKIRSADMGGNVYLSQRDGVDMLVISERVDGTEYRLYIYYYNGWLRETYVESGLYFELWGGENIVPAEDFSIQDLGNGLLLFTLKNSGGSVSRMTVSLRS